MYVYGIACMHVMEVSSVHAQCNYDVYTYCMTILQVVRSLRKLKISNTIAVVFESQSLVIDGRKDSTLSCYHQYAGSIRLTVELSNGTNITENSRRDIIYHTCFHIENRTLHYTVTIPSKPEYYGARVVCIAVFHDQFVNESSQPMLTLTTTSRM